MLVNMLHDNKISVMSSIINENSKCARTLFTTLTNCLNKLECHITLVWKGLQGVNTLAYWFLS